MRHERFLMIILLVSKKYVYINSILAIIYLNEQVLNKQVLKPD